MKLLRHFSSLIAVFAALAGLRTARAGPAFPEFVDPNPSAGNRFGEFIVPLSTGNVVITSSLANVGGSKTGAVYLFNGATGALISTLTGSTALNEVGSQGVKALTNGNFVVMSPNWDGAAQDVGAVTWGNGTTGVSGVVSAANSLVGTTLYDNVGSAGVVALPNGNYVVRSQVWDGAAADVGAVTWGNGTTGSSGVVSAANSLVGTTLNDQVGYSGVTALTNGNYVVGSMLWNGAAVDVGAVTWGNGTTGISGAVSAANSLVGSTAGDFVSNGGMMELTNGNYLVRSMLWDNGGAVDAGAVTWGNGTTGISGAVSAANSLVGSTLNDKVGNNGVTVLTNGNYVVRSTLWNGAAVDVGAVTWGNGTTGINGAVSAANSLVGTTLNDKVGSNGVTALTNGNFVVMSTLWDGAAVDVGAVTWGNGTTGSSGLVSAANSLVGTTLNDQVGFSGVTALTNGNYVVMSEFWEAADVGAVTWGNGTTGSSGVVSAANSLVGSTGGDNVGNNLFFKVTALPNGNYLVRTTLWDNGLLTDAGAVTFGSGTTGVTGVINTGNSAIGFMANSAPGIPALDNVNNHFIAGFPGEGKVRLGSQMDGFAVIAPEIVVTQAAALTDGAGSVAFGTVVVGGSSAPLTFTITNTGAADLTGLVVTRNGANATDFTVSALSSTSVPVGAGTATVIVTFSPGSTGARTAALHLASNDADENPFDIALTGTGTHISSTLTGGALVITDGSGGSDTFSLSQSGGNLVIGVGAGTLIGTNAGTGDGTNSVSIPLASITGAITVNAGAGADIINIGAFTTALAGLTVNGGTGDDTVNFNGDITFAANGNLDVDLQNDSVTPGADIVNVAGNANLIASSTGTITVKVSKNVAMSAGSSFETVNGGITIEANQQTVATTGSFVGIKINNGLVRSTGTGQVSVNGRGGNTGTDQYGVNVDNGGDL